MFAVEKNRRERSQSSFRTIFGLRASSFNYSNPLNRVTAKEFTRREINRDALRDVRIAKRVRRCGCSLHHKKRKKDGRGAREYRADKERKRKHRLLEK